MSGDELRDVIAEVVRADRWRSDCGEGTADAILAMPEMAAIKEFLLRYAETQSAATVGNWNDSPRDVLEAVLGDEGQPVIDWVLGGAS